MYLSTVIFAYDGIGSLLPAENKMKNPRNVVRWNGPINAALIFVIFFYSLTGFLGYLKYGDDVKDTITLNLPAEQW